MTRLTVIGSGNTASRRRRGASSPSSIPGQHLSGERAQEIEATCGQQRKERRSEGLQRRISRKPPRVTAPPAWVRRGQILRQRSNHRDDRVRLSAVRAGHQNCADDALATSPGSRRGGALRRMGGDDHCWPKLRKSACPAAFPRRGRAGERCQMKASTIFEVTVASVWRDSRHPADARRRRDEQGDDAQGPQFPMG